MQISGKVPAHVSGQPVEPQARTPLVSRRTMEVVSRLAMVTMAILFLAQIEGADAKAKKGFWKGVGKVLNVALDVTGKLLNGGEIPLGKGGCIVIDRVGEAALRRGLGVHVDIPLGQACGAE